MAAATLVTVFADRHIGRGARGSGGGQFSSPYPDAHLVVARRGVPPPYEALRERLLL